MTENTAKKIDELVCEIPAYKMMEIDVRHDYVSGSESSSDADRKVCVRWNR